MLNTCNFKKKLQRSIFLCIAKLLRISFLQTTFRRLFLSFMESFSLDCLLTNVYLVGQVMVGCIPCPFSKNVINLAINFLKHSQHSNILVKHHQTLSAISKALGLCQISMINLIFLQKDFIIDVCQSSKCTSSILQNSHF